MLLYSRKKKYVGINTSLFITCCAKADIIKFIALHWKPHGSHTEGELTVKFHYVLLQNLERIVDFATKLVHFLPKSVTLFQFTLEVHLL